jgi:rare lipoprotein A
MEKSIATWYGPGLWGNQTACGQKLRRKTVGVAHRKLPCGTEVTIAYKGETLTTEVIDRGPYANDADWDLTQAAAKALDFTETDEIRTSVERKRK